MSDKTILHKIEDFPGVVILADEHKVITKDNLDILTEEWRQERGDFDTFSSWLEEKFLYD